MEAPRRRSDFTSVPVSTSPASSVSSTWKSWVALGLRATLTAFGTGPAVADGAASAGHAG